MGWKRREYVITGVIIGVIFGIITLSPIFWMLGLNLGYFILEEISIELTQGSLREFGQRILMPVINILVYAAIFSLIGLIIGKIVSD